MRHLRSAFMIGFVLMAAGSCQPRGGMGDGSGANPDETLFEEIVSHPRDVTWSALLDLINDRMWRANDINEPNGTMAIAAFPLTTDTSYCRCGSGRRDSYVDHQARMNIAIKRVTSSGTSIRLATLIDATDASGRYSNRVMCKSSGKLERDIRAAIDSIVVARRGK